jgi:predicted DNA-binding protein (UPF0251 family)
MTELEQVTLMLDEVEALRLADLDGLYQEVAAQKMKISRTTFARIIEQARRKMAEALIHGKALRLEGGTVVVKAKNNQTEGKENMPKGDGTGPMKAGQGTGRGPCGCGHRHGAARPHGAGRGGCCGGKANTGPTRCSTKAAPAGKQEKR